MRFRAFLASAAALVGASFYFTTDPGPLTFAFVVAWQVIFVALAFILLKRGRP